MKSEQTEKTKDQILRRLRVKKQSEGLGPQEPEDPLHKDRLKYKYLFSLLNGREVRDRRKRLANGGQSGDGQREGSGGVGRKWGRAKEVQVSGR